MNSQDRVVARYLTAHGQVDEATAKLTQVSNLLSTLQASLKLVDDLVAAGERRRIGRVSDINVGVIDFDESRVTARVVGTTGHYDVRITVTPRRGHHCTCPDWAQNGQRVGPCKHVLALGLSWKNENLLPATDIIINNLDDILQRVV